MNLCMQAASREKRLNPNTMANMHVNWLQRLTNVCKSFRLHVLARGDSAAINSACAVVSALEAL